MEEVVNERNDSVSADDERLASESVDPERRRWIVSFSGRHYPRSSMIYPFSSLAATVRLDLSMYTRLDRNRFSSKICGFLRFFSRL